MNQSVLGGRPRAGRVDKTRAYWLASGALLALVSLLGFAMSARGLAVAWSPWLLFDRPHDVAHAALGALAIALGLLPLPGGISRKLALGVGTFYLALAVLGFLNGSLYGYPLRFGVRVHLEVVENLLHLGLGAWGAYVGTDAPEGPAS